MIKITPDTYIAMNTEFEEEGTPFRLTIPTQEEIDTCLEKSDHHHPKVVHKHMLEKEIELHFGSSYEKDIDELTSQQYGEYQ